MIVRPSRYAPGRVYIDVVGEHLSPEDARKAAARILRVAERVEKAAQKRRKA